MLNGLSLFSGIGGIDLALSEWITPILYCERERYAQGVLLSRMSDGQLPVAPIWDDVRTLHLEPGLIDIVYGGFPCQDLSAAGAGAGLAGERSGLYFELERIIKEAKPTFVFLENVPAIRTRGLGRVVWGLSELGYDLRWTTLSAAEVGAPHLRKRWFLLAYSRDPGAPRLDRGISAPVREENCKRKTTIQPVTRYSGKAVANTEGAVGQRKRPVQNRQSHRPPNCGDSMADTESERYEGSGVVNPNIHSKVSGRQSDITRSNASSDGWWSVEPDVGRVAHGIPARVDRLRGLGNAVVPQQAREAFKRLAGIGG